MGTELASEAPQGAASGRPPGQANGEMSRGANHKRVRADQEPLGPGDLRLHLHSAIFFL